MFGEELQNYLQYHSNFEKIATEASNDDASYEAQLTNVKLANAVVPYIYEQTGSKDPIEVAISLCKEAACVASPGKAKKVKKATIVKVAAALAVDVALEATLQDAPGQAKIAARQCLGREYILELLKDVF